jgi:RNA methyltransferase, TrmH family
MLKPIASKDNPRYKEWLKLTQSSRSRKQTGLSVLEGDHLVQAYRERYGAPQAMVYCEGAAQVAPHAPAAPAAPAASASARGAKAAAGDTVTQSCPSYVLPEALFRPLSQVENGPGPLAIIDTPRPALPTQLRETCLLLDNLQDPGNLGTILRTAAAAGVRQVFLSANCVYAWSPKVVRSGMGAHFALDVFEGCELAEILGVVAENAHGMGVLATSSHAKKNLYQTDLRRPIAWLFGNEGQGVSQQLLAQVKETVSIPMPGVAESLNVAVAVAVCLFEQVRQQGK